MQNPQPYDPATFLPWAKFNGINFHDDTVTIKDIGGEKGWGLIACKTISGSGNDGDVIPVSRTEGSGGGKEINGEQEQEAVVLLTVPKDLVLSLSLVEEHARSDRDLREVLEAVGPFGKTARGAILVFLMVQSTHLSTQHGANQSIVSPTTTSNGVLSSSSIGVSHPLTHYVRSLLPTPVPLPTFYSSSEIEILFGTSLDDALEQKLSALEREFEHILESTSSIPWCSRIWWDRSEDDEDNDETDSTPQIGHSATTSFTFQDYLKIDSLYRSRALDLPGTGHAMVPCIDMANHASRSHTKALYETDRDGNAVLIMADGINSIPEGTEITISYGDDKGASEMVYSYGFIEQDPGIDDEASARQLFLDLEIPEDDPLRRIKRAVCGEAPGVRIFERPRQSPPQEQQDEDLSEQEIGWESPFIYWAVVNQEDGLDFTRTYPPRPTSSSSITPSQTTDSTSQIQTLWQTHPLPSPSTLPSLLLSSPLADLFRLRALTLIHQRVRSQLNSLAISSQPFSELADQINHNTLNNPNTPGNPNPNETSGIRPTVYATISTLRVLEQRLLERADRQFEREIEELVSGSAVVREWFAAANHAAAVADTGDHGEVGGGEDGEDEDGDGDGQEGLSHNAEEEEDFS